MKNLLTKSGKYFTVIMLMFLSVNAFAGDHVTMYASNCVQTGPTTLTIDLYVVNDGTTGLQLNSLNYGLNVDPAILSGGTASWAFVPGTSDLPSSVTRTFSYGYTPVVHQLRLASSTSGVTSSNAPALQSGKPIHVGTFTITNSSKLADKMTGSLSLQAVTARGLTNTGVVVYSSGAPTVTNLNITGTNRNIGQSVVLAVNSAVEASLNGKMEAYPNPAHDKLNVKFSSNKNDNYILQLVDVSGRLVINKSNAAQKGNNLVELDITNFAAGNYTLSLIAADGSKQDAKIVVK